ncbi:MAG: hypothetical protein WCO85_08620 [Actinomycetes bacterium]|jgi:hypothetical protein
MFKKNPPSWRCVACKAPIAMDAYYCKKCGSLVSLDLAPNAREIDRTFRTKLHRAWHMRAVAKITWTVVVGVSLVSGSYFANTIRIARVDNHSSATFVMKVDSPSNPFQCSGTICQVTVEITNKTNQAATLVGIPFFTLANGEKYGPADLTKGSNHLYFADKYCHQNFNLTFKPRESKKFLGICTENLPGSQIVSGIEILSGISGSAQQPLVLSVDLKVEVPSRP